MYPTCARFNLAILSYCGKLVRPNHEDFDFNGTTSSGSGSDKSEDATVETVYDGLGNVTKLIAVDKDANSIQGDDEVTKYYYLDLYDASLANHIVYPDSSADETGGNTDKVTMGFHLDGKMTWRSDQRGTAINYYYDSRRNQYLEKVTTLGGNTDNDIQSIRRYYDGIGRMYVTRSYASKRGKRPRPINKTRPLTRLLDPLPASFNCLQFALGSEYAADSPPFEEDRDAEVQRLCITTDHHNSKC